MNGSPETSNPLSNVMPQPDHHSPIGAMCAVTTGRSYTVTTPRMLNQSIESLAQKLQSGVVIQFEKVGPDPPPVVLQNTNKPPDVINEPVPPAWHSTRCFVYVRTANGKGAGHWPIPEAFWSDQSLPQLPPRSAHPVVKFLCAGVEPHVMDSLPFDKYELEVSPLTQYIISRKQPHLAWQVYISTINKPNELGPPFGYLKASTNLTCVNLFVMPYNYPVLLPILEEILKKPQHPNKPPREWRVAFDEYIRSMPAYYANPLRKVLARMGIPGNLVPESLDANCFSYAVHGKLKQYKNEAKNLFDKLVISVAIPKIQNYETVTVLQCGNSLKSQVESTSYVNMKSTGTPASHFSFRFLNMRSELNEFSNYMVRVRDKISTIPCNENLKVKHTFRNPYDIDRRDLIDQIQLMRANFMQNPSRIKFKDEDQIHTLPVSQMGNYQDYLKKRPNPLREIESTPVRQHMFGNPFKIDKRGMMVDEADIDLGSSSPKNKKINPDQRRRGPLPKDFEIFGPEGFEQFLAKSRSKSLSPSPSPSPSTSPTRAESSDTNASSSDETLPKEQNGNKNDQELVPHSDDSDDEDNTEIKKSPKNDKLKVKDQELIEYTPQRLILSMRHEIFKQLRRPGTNFTPIIETLSTIKGDNQKFLIDETKREAKRFKRQHLLEQIDSIKHLE